MPSITINAPEEPETEAEKAKRIVAAVGPKSYANGNESTVFHSIQDAIAWDKYCAQKKAANAPCAAVTDCPIVVGRESC